MKITTLTKDQFNRMDKNKYYREINTVTEDEQIIKDWLAYRGTPNAEVFKFVRPNGVVWRVEVNDANT